MTAAANWRSAMNPVKVLCPCFQQLRRGKG
jgi:hypothetical protein